jgi:large subunit ribosomal protein L5
MKTIQEKQKAFFTAHKDEFGYTNVFSAPTIEKVIVSVGTGKRARNEKGWNELVADRLAKITGQKPSARPAKKSIATFKLREGEIIGQSVTLRGDRMFAFLEKLINVALPRTKDFRGVNMTGVDSLGNMTLGIKEHSIFPETGEEELRDVFGLSVTIVTTAKTQKEAQVFFTDMGVPFVKA